MNTGRRISIIVVTAVVIVLLTLPCFFSTYRTMAFQTIPRDDYAPFLLYLVGENDNFELGSPSGYRLFTVALAVPFYYVTPVYEFSNLDETDHLYLKATQAIAAVSYLSMLVTLCLIYVITRRNFMGSVSTSLIASFMALLYFGFVALYAADSVAIMIIALLVYLMDRPRWFAVAIPVSIGFNEKIPLIFLMLYVARFLLDRHQRRNSLQFVASAFAFVSYFVVKALVGLPGHEHQTDPAEFMANIPRVFLLAFSAKGLLLIVIPCLLLVAAYVLAAKNPGRGRHWPTFSRADVWPLVGLALVSMGAGVDYNVGRIAMFCFPLYIPLAADHLCTVLAGGRSIDVAPDHLTDKS